MCHLKSLLREIQNVREPNGKKFILTGLDDESVTLVPMKKILEKTYITEEASIKLPLEELNREKLEEVMIPETLYSALMDDEGRMKGAYNLQARNLIREARKKYVEAGHSVGCVDSWMKLLCVPHLFRIVLAKAIPQGKVQLDKYLECHQEFKETYKEIFGNNRFDPAEEKIVISTVENTMFPEVFVVNRETGAITQVNEYSVEELLNMQVENLIVEERECEYMDETYCLVYIYSYYLYPHRMKRFSNTEKKELDPYDDQPF